MGAGPGPGGLGSAYDRTREAAITGVVVDSPAQGRGAGILTTLSVRTESGEVTRVRLGPPWYLASLGLNPGPGDPVQVIGMAPGAPGRGAMIAREVMWQGRTYLLRNAQGKALWAGAGNPQWMRYGGLWGPDPGAPAIGEIEAVEEMWPGGSAMGPGVLLRMRTRERAQLRVHLGPAWYVAARLPDLRPGQEVTVTGPRVEWGQEEVILAGELQRERERLRLRDREGRPEWAGGWQNWSGWGPGSRYGGMYNPTSVQTMTGRLERVEEGAPLDGMGLGMIATVRTQERDQVRAHLGPLWYVEPSELQLSPGDEVTLRGSMVSLGDGQVMMVQSLRVGGRTIELRDESGLPAWAGPGAR